jgi:predicted kinase
VRFTDATTGALLGELFVGTQPGPGLVVIAGLPGTGKSAVAALLARRLQAAYLRIDTIEQSLVNSGELRTKPYAAGYITDVR